MEVSLLDEESIHGKENILVDLCQMFYVIMDHIGLQLIFNFQYILFVLVTRIRLVWIRIKLLPLINILALLW